MPRRLRPKPAALLPLLLVAAFPVLAPRAGSARAATLSPGLARRLATARPDEPLPILVFLHEQAPLGQLRAAQKARRADRRESHREVIEALQQAARSQQPLLESLRAKRSIGEVEALAPYWIANLLAVRARPAAILEIAARPEVDWIEPAFRAVLVEPVSRTPAGSFDRSAAGKVDRNVGRPSSKRNDDAEVQAKADRSGVPDGIRALRAPQVWSELGLTGAGRLVANLDTGVDGHHPALRRRWRGARDGVDPRHAWFNPADTADVFPFDPHGHGTHVLGTMTGLGPETADTIGVAWAADWIASNAIQVEPSEEVGDPVIAAFQWFADPDGDPATVDDVPDVVQNSWGIAPDEAEYVACDSRWWSVVDACEAAGVVVTWSAGNSGPSASTIIVPADRATSATNSFSIGAVRATGTSFPYILAGFSSRGPTPCTADPPNRTKPEVVAPGVNVYSSVPGGYAGGWSGTSMAGPHVAGIVALLREANPDLDAETIKTILMETARDLGRPGEDNDYGWGFVDAFAAVERAMTGFGRIEGTVRNGSVESAPLASAVVRLVETSRVFRGDAEGRYRGAAAAGTYRVTAAVEGFAADTAEVTFIPGETLRRDFLLLDNSGPWLTARDAPAATGDTLGPYRLSFEAGDPSGLASARVEYRVNGKPWISSPTRLDGERIDAEIPGVGPAHRIEYYAEVVDRAGLASVWPAPGPDGPAVLEVRRRIYFEDFEDAQAPGWVVGAAEDSATEGLWIQADPVAAFDGPRATQPDHDHTPDPGTRCFVTANAVPGAPPGEADVDGGCTTLTSPSFDLSRETEVHVFGWFWFGKGGASTDDTLHFDLSTDGGLTWRPLDRIFEPDTIWRFHTVRLAKNTPLTHSIRFRLRACDQNQPGVTEAALDDFALEAFLPPRPLPEPIPEATLLLSPSPNPCRGGCALRFDLPSWGRVRLTVHDILGRLVRVLRDEDLGPGRHRIPWDLSDESGRRLPVGVYFLRLQATGSTASRSFIVLRGPGQ